MRGPAFAAMKLPWVAFDEIVLEPHDLPLAFRTRLECRRLEPEIAARSAPSRAADARRVLQE